MIREFIREQAVRHSHAAAILAPGCEPLSYEHLDSVIARMGETLARLGITRQSRAALVCSNGPHAAVAFLGLAAHTGCAPLNPVYSASEFEFYLSDLGVQAVVVEAGLDCAVSSVAASLGIPILEMKQRPSRLAGDIEFPDDLGIQHPNAAANLSSDGSDPALLLHTSGTTSRPKLVPLTQANLLVSARHIADTLGLAAADRCLNVMPLFHIHDWKRPYCPRSLLGPASYVVRDSWGRSFLSGSKSSAQPGIRPFPLSTSWH